jgi:hypothetical protein
MGLKINKHTNLSNYTTDELRQKAIVTLSQLTNLQKDVIPMIRVQRAKLPDMVEGYKGHDNTADLFYYLYLRLIYVFSYEISEKVVSKFIGLQDLKNQGRGNSISQKEEFIAIITEISHYIIKMKESLSEDNLLRLNPIKKQFDLVGAHVVGNYSFYDILGEIRSLGITDNLIKNVIDDVVPTEPMIEEL